jgi:hypothetical protein
MEELRAQLEELSEQEAEHAQIIVTRPEADVAGLPDGRGETLTGEPKPNVVAAMRRVRDEHRALAAISRSGVGQRIVCGW